jgi:cation diffusion facilitator family transporter
MSKKQMQDQKNAVALSSVFAGVVLTLGKLVVGLMTGSMGILSEAAHSLLDFFAALLTYFAVKISGRPADESHPYGYGKIESVSALIETGLLFLTSAWIIYESVHRLITGKTEVEVTWYAFAVVLVSIAIDIGRSRSLMKVAKATNSQALEADALHFKSDIYSSCVVGGGLVLVMLGVSGGDTIAAIGVSFFVLHAGWQLGKRTINTLVDSAPLGLAEKAREIIAIVPGVISVDRVRARAFGAQSFIDAEVVFDRQLPLVIADKMSDEIRAQIAKDLPGADIVIHMHAGQVNDESIIKTVSVLALQQDVAVHHIIVDHLADKRYVSYDIEVPADATVKQAHDIADNFEELLTSEIGSGIELYSHIEPSSNETLKSKEVCGKEAEEITKTINEIVNKSKLASQPHDVVIRRLDGQLLITLHCLIDGGMKIDKAHRNISQLEHLIHSQIIGIERLVIHTEPR